jgi:peptidoglycan hydrolase-like protein with peptidoglycan-binding domain
MRRLIATSLALLLCLCCVAASAQNTSTTTGNANAAATPSKRGPVFRATKDQIKQAQTLLKSRNLYTGDITGKLSDDTRTGLREYQKAEGLKVTGTLNRVTLEKMNIELTEKQKGMGASGQKL